MESTSVFLSLALSFSHTHTASLSLPLSHSLSLSLSLSAGNIAIVAAVGLVPCASLLRDDATVRTSTRAWTRSLAYGVPSIVILYRVTYHLAELCDVAARARTRERPLFSRTKFAQRYIGARYCTTGKYEDGHSRVFGMPGMAQRIWTTHTPAAQPVCAHADTA